MKYYHLKNIGIVHKLGLYKKKHIYFIKSRHREAHRKNYKDFD